MAAAGEGVWGGLLRYVRSGMSPSPTKRLFGNRYLVQEPLGTGTTATVYRARDEKLGLQRAIKILSPKLVHLEAMRQRFEREAMTTSSLEHPNIVRVHDWGTDGDDLYIVMELIAGGTLREVMEISGKWPPRKAAALIQQALHALQYSHALGVVHRDIKPRNIMVRLSGTAMLTDFGLAHVLDDEVLPGASSGVMGTFGYMAPEQRVDSGKVDNRTDIFATGATLYTILTNKHPPERFDDPKGQRWRTEVPPPLAEVIAGATRYNPEDRYPTAARMAEALTNAHLLLPVDKPFDEATMLVERFSTDSVVRSKQLDFSDLEQREAEAHARKEARRQRLEARRTGGSVPTGQESSSGAAWWIGGVVLVALGLLALVAWKALA